MDKKTLDYFGPPTIHIGGGRSGGKRMAQNKSLLKQWPVGTIAHVSTKGIHYSELADAEEING